MEEDLQKKLDAIYKSVEKTRKYFLWTLIVTLVTFVAPLLIALVALPYIFRVYTSQLGL